MNNIVLRTLGLSLALAALTNCLLSQRSSALANGLFGTAALQQFHFDSTVTATIP